MTNETRKFIHDVIAECLGFPLDRVIWRNQDAPKQDNPIVTLFIYSLDGMAMPDMRYVGDLGKMNMYVPTDGVLEVQMFDRKGQFPVDRLNGLVRMLEAPTIVEKCADAGVAFFDSEPVQDITALLPNKQQYEPRAAVDIRFRYTEVTTVDSYIIDTVNVEGDTDGRTMQFTVSIRDE